MAQKYAPKDVIIVLSQLQYQLFLKPRYTGTKNAEKNVKYSAWRRNYYEQPENGFTEHQYSSIRRSQLINISELELLAKKTCVWNKRQKSRQIDRI